MVSGILELVMRIAVALILPKLIGENGIYFAEPAAWLGAVLMLVGGYYYRIHKISVRLQGGKSRSTVVKENQNEKRKRPCKGRSFLYTYGLAPVGTDEGRMNLFPDQRIVELWAAIGVAVHLALPVGAQLIEIQFG